MQQGEQSRDAAAERDGLGPLPKPAGKAADAANNPPLNYLLTDTGKAAAVCQYCGTVARPTRPNDNGEPDLWNMARGWSEAPFPADHKHDDESVGSRYTCPACNKLLRRGHTLQTRGGQRAWMVT